MNKVLYDLFEAQPFGTSKFHGGGEYIKSVFRHLVINYSRIATIYVYYNFDAFLDEWLLQLIDEYSIKSFDVKDRSDVAKIIKKEGVDVWYSGIPYHYVPTDVEGKAILKGTIHGLRSIEMPADKYSYLYTNGKQAIKEKIKYYARSVYKKRELKRFHTCIEMLDEIVCDSEHSKYSIIQKFSDVNKENVKVFYAPQKITKISTSAVDGRPYILLLGGDRWVKNTYRAIKALDKLYTKNLISEYDVKIVGNLNKKILSRIKNRSYFLELGYVDTEVLEELYCNCDILLYPSLNEGFGLPPLEAMKYGKTCVVSGVCSLPEVCGDAVYYVNPVDCDEIATRVLCALDQHIHVKVAIEQFNKILQRENKDIDDLCQFILSK